MNTAGFRFFQNSGFNKNYLKYFNITNGFSQSFQSRLQSILEDRYAASHILLPILDMASDSFFTYGDDEILQRSWAKSNGLPKSTPLEDILLCQIENHKAEVFYNLDPVRYGNKFLRRLPGTVRHTLAWRAAPSDVTKFDQYDCLLCNFPSILEHYRKLGTNAEYFFPSHDPVMDRFAQNSIRSADVVFVGGFTRHHKNRTKLLESVSELSGEFRIFYYLDQSIFTKIAESPLGVFFPVGDFKRPNGIKKISHRPVFGLELYKVLSGAKIVLNGAIDMAGEDRGNMRCFEAMGCGALLLSDEGHYPNGFVNNDNFVTYRNSFEALELIRFSLNNDSYRLQVSKNGYEHVKLKYSKLNQWNSFMEILGTL